MSDSGRPCDCGEALEKLYDFLDGELPGASGEEIAAHLEQCRACWPQFNFERLFLDRLAATGECTEPSPKLAERIRAVLDAESSGQS